MKHFSVGEKLYMDKQPNAVVTKSGCSSVSSNILVENTLNANIFTDTFSMNMFANCHRRQLTTFAHYVH